MFPFVINDRTPQVIVHGLGLTGEHAYIRRAVHPTEHASCELRLEHKLRSVTSALVDCHGAHGGVKLP